MIEDRVTGRSHQLHLPRNIDPIRLSLSPDARKLALQVSDQGQWKVELFDLSKTIEPDEPSGINLSPTSSN